MNIIFATKNEGKMKEVNSILRNTGINVISMLEAGIDIDVVEDGETFEENAAKKAVEISKLTDKPVLADDSGLEIDFLDKAPGVLSARYLGEKTSYDIKNRKILELMDGVPANLRTARFVSVISYASAGKEIFTTRATVEGVISHEIKGDNGFGYDPIFFIPERNRTTAQLTLEEKNEISHRGKALRQMKEFLQENLK